MAKAKKLPSGNWRVLLYDGKNPDGTRHYESFTAETALDAELEAMSYKKNKKRRISGNITVGEALDSYIASKDKVLSPSTVREYKRSRNNDMQNLIQIPLRKLTQNMIQTEINKESMTHSPKSVRNMYFLLTAALNTYLPDFKPIIQLPQKIKKQLYVPTDDDIKRLIHGVKDSHMLTAILLSAFGSLRRSEICALETTDLAGNVVSINKALVQNDTKEWVLSKTKTYDSTRLVDYPLSIIATMNIPDSGKIVKYNPNQISKRFSNILKKLNIQHFRFHDLRHYQASILCALGIPEKYIMERGGWGSDEVLNKIYTHTMEFKKNETRDIAFSHFEKLMQHEMQHEKK